MKKMDNVHEQMGNFSQEKNWEKHETNFRKSTVEAVWGRESYGGG